jgi:hypothetical protein
LFSKKLIFTLLFKLLLNMELVIWIANTRVTPAVAHFNNYLIINKQMATQESSIKTLRHVTGSQTQFIISEKINVNGS